MREPSRPSSARICWLSPESVYLAALPVAHNYPLSSPGVSVPARAASVSRPNSVLSASVSRAR